MNYKIIESISDLPDTRRIFVDTFSHEPSFKFMLPDDQKRKEQVKWIVDKKLRLLSSYYHAFTTEGEVKGFSWWYPPGMKPALSVFDQLKVGYWKAPFLFGPKSFARMFLFSNQESRILKRYLQEPHWILDVIATDPQAQRSGLGGALMQPVFDLAAKENVPCFVLTHNPRNVGFYQKYGFKLVIEEPVLGEKTPVAYGLVRPARH